MHEVTRSLYKVLVDGGVEIHKYAPGYIHAKLIISDDETTVIGTINLDYRSFYLHYECGVWAHDVPAIAHMRADFEATVEVGQLVTADVVARSDGGA